MVKRTILLIAGTALLLSSYAAAEQSAKITEIPEGVELAAGKSSLEVQILEDAVVRVHVELDGKSTPRTLVMDPHARLRAPAAVQRSERDGVYTLSTRGITVRIDEAQPFKLTFLDGTGGQLLESDNPLAEAAKAGLTMLHASGDTLYGIHGLGRDDTNVGLTRNEGGLVAAGVQGDSGAPFIFSARYGLLIDSDGGEFTPRPAGSPSRTTLVPTWSISFSPALRSNPWLLSLDSSARHLCLRSGPSAFSTASGAHRSPKWKRSSTPTGRNKSPSMASSSTSIGKHGARTTTASGDGTARQDRAMLRPTSFPMALPAPSLSAWQARASS